MTMRFRFVCHGMALLLSMAAGGPVWGDQGKALFDAQCASCHTIGGGDSGGPDLKGIVSRRPADWLERVIAEPGKLTAEKDATQVELVKKYGYGMPDLGISRDAARQIIAFIAAASGSGPSTGPSPQRKGVAATPGLAAAGKALFTGEQRFSAGGPPCAGCHAFAHPGVQGGSLASDLTTLHTGMGEQGMRGALSSLGFPVMKSAYAGRPLNEEEIAALTAFAREAAGQKSPPAGNGAALPGVALFFCGIVALTLYKRRIG